MHRIIVNVENLVLRGFRHEDRHAIGAVIQEEIGRELAAADAAQRIGQLGSTPTLRIANVSVPERSNPQQVGAAAGRAVGRGLIK